METEKIILFDGVCNFCNSSVNFVIKRNKAADIKFATLQSNTGMTFLKQYGLPVSDMQSFVFIENGVAYTKSTGALKVCKYLSGLWPLCKFILIIPKFIRDGVYGWVAKNRYKWFGQKESCMIPSPDIKARFLD